MILRVFRHSFQVSFFLDQKTNWSRGNSLILKNRKADELTYLRIRSDLSARALKIALNVISRVFFYAINWCRFQIITNVCLLFTELNITSLL
jgi:hypothetical protein